MGANTWPRRIALLMSIVVVLAVIVTSPGPGASYVKQQLDALQQLRSPQQVEAYLRAHPALDLELADADARGIARWWNEQSSRDQKQLVRVTPRFVGNLQGVDYASRDRANRRQLATMLSATRAEAMTNPHDEAAAVRLRSLKAIASAIGAAHQPARYLTSLTSDARPLAAVSIGDLDTATQVTFNVPGMGTYTDDMQLWAQSAQNVWEEQGRAGAPRERAVVAWIGYQTPPPGIDAALGDYAVRGAPRLIAAIDGVWAARYGADVTMNVVAHSYGTTTAADALFEKDLGIYAFVMLGSAGIEDRIPDAAALHARHVYAGEAAADPEARLGRTTRRDPRSPSFGATVLSVDGDAAEGLLPVTGHDPVLHSAWNDDPISSAWSNIKSFDEFAKRYEAHFRTYGYLDAGTESVYNVATATTPHATRSLTIDR